MKDEEYYFVLHPSPDGMYVTAYTRAGLMEAIENGDINANRVYEEGLPSGSDMNYWKEGYLIIKGRVVKPIPRDVVVSWSID